MKLILECKHEITRGGLVETAADGDGFRAFYTLGQVIPLDVLRDGVRCEQCGADKKIVAIG